MPTQPRTVPATAPPAKAAAPAQPTREELLRQLREPFMPEQIGKLPKNTCRECIRSANKVCDNAQHQKARCTICRNFISRAHIHLDYVGHAAVTNRLLDVAPGWEWEPFALDANGLPAMDKAGGLWIKLTVLGLTRPGYGDTTTDHGGVKETIGDAIRNAAMGFGIALELWSKEDLQPGESQEVQPDPAAQRNGASNGSSGRNWIEEAKRAREVQTVIDLGYEANALGEFDGPVKEFLIARRAELSQPVTA